MQAQFAAERGIIWTTDDGTVPDLPWVREIAAVRGGRQRPVRSAEAIPGVRSPTATILGYAELVEDADNLYDAGISTTPYGRGRFCRRVWYVTDADERAIEAGEAPPDTAVDPATITAGEAGTPVPTPAVTAHDRTQSLAQGND